MTTDNIQRKLTAILSADVVGYSIVAWLLIQFADIAFPQLNFPSWTVPFVIVILIIGFPLALLFAWPTRKTLGELSLNNIADKLGSKGKRGSV